MFIIITCLVTKFNKCTLAKHVVLFSTIFCTRPIRTY